MIKNLNSNISFNYDKEVFESVLCNLCGSERFFVLAKKSVNGLDTQTCLCKDCGLIYINPRMTREGYDGYYKHFYRKDRSSIKGKDLKDIDLDKSFEHAKVFGTALAKKLSDFITSGLTIDVGSSTGGVLYGLKKVIPNLEVFGIEPSVDESNFANKKGIKTDTCLFEDFDKHEFGGVSNILCVQSLNHLLDPKKFLLWSFDNLKEGGHIILAVKNFRHQCRRAGRIEAGGQIDHPYMFTPETLKLLVESAGFKVVYMDIDEGKRLPELVGQRKMGLPTHHIRIVGEKLFERTVPSGVDKNSKILYKRLRFQLWKPFLKMHYLFFYSYRFSFLRKFLHIRQ